MDHLKLALMTGELAQAILLSVILVSYARSRSDPRLWLGLFIAAYGFSFFGEIGIATGLFESHVHLIIPALAGPLFMGPALYVYLLALTEKGFKVARGRLIRHAIAPMAGTVLACGLVFLPSEVLQRALLRDLPGEQLVDLFAILAAGGVELIGFGLIATYTVWGLVKIHRHNLTIRDQFSNIERKTLNWLRILILSLAALGISVGVADLFQWTQNPTVSVVLLLWEITTFLVLGVLGFRQGLIFGDARMAPARAVMVEDAPAPAQADLPEPPADKGKYTKSALARADMERIARKIATAVERDALFEDSNLSLSILSRHIGVQPAYVSQTLSQMIGTSFYDYIARARVTEAMKILADSDDSSTVLDTAMRVGFNSKSTFNAAFKRACGQTPTEWRRQMLASAGSPPSGGSRREK